MTSRATLRCSVLLLGTLLCACSAPPPTPARAISNGRPSAIATEAAPCALATTLVEGARRSVDDGRLLRAQIQLERARELCSQATEGASSLALGLQRDLGEDDGRAHSSSNALFGDDAVDTSTGEVESTYRAAARAFRAGKLEETARLAMSAAILGRRGAGARELTVEAFILAARAAEATGDPVKARRMFARAAWVQYGRQGEQAPRATLPVGDLFTLAATFPGLTPPQAACGGGASDADSLTPDGQIAIFTRSDHIDLRLIPSRVLFDRVSLPPPTVGVRSPRRVCFSADAAFVLEHEPGAARAGRLGESLRAISVPEKDFEYWDDHDAAVRSDGAAYLPNFRTSDDEMTWFQLKRGETSLRRATVAGGRSWEFLLGETGFLGSERTRSEVGFQAVVYDAATGKRRSSFPWANPSHEVIAARDGTWAAGPVNYDKIQRIDVEGARVQVFERPASSSILGIMGRSRVLLKDAPARQLFAMDTSIAELDGVVITEPRAQLANQRRSVGHGRVALRVADGISILDLRTGRATHEKLSPRDADERILRGSPIRSAQPCRKGPAECSSKLDLFVSQGVLYRGHPRSTLTPERLGEVDATTDSANILEDPLTPGVLIFSEFPIVLATSRAGVLEKARVVLGTEGGFVTDDEGYYEFFGPVTEAFRASATCGPDLPIELCSDRFEAPGLLERFLHDDFTYRRR